MVKIEIKLSNQQVREWYHFLGLKFGGGEKRTLKWMVKQVLLQTIAAGAKKEADIALDHLNATISSKKT